MSRQIRQEKSSLRILENLFAARFGPEITSLPSSFLWKRTPRIDAFTLKYCPSSFS